MDRVRATMDGYAPAIAACDVTTGVLTSATRDAANGAAFVEEIRTRYGVDARVIDGDTEARLTFLGATSDRPPSDGGRCCVIDIGGRLDRVRGRAPGGASPSASPRRPASFARPSATCTTIRRGRRAARPRWPAEVRGSSPRPCRPRCAIRGAAREAVAVAGTATQCAADRAVARPLRRRPGARLPADAGHVHRACWSGSRPCRSSSAGGRYPACIPSGLPTIVAGVVILIEVMRAFGLEGVEVSEHDILYGATAIAAVEEVPAWSDPIVLDHVRLAEQDPFPDTPLRMRNWRVRALLIQHRLGLSRHFISAPPVG